MYLSGPEETDGLQVFHGVSVLGVDALKQVDLLLQDLRLGVDHTDHAGLDTHHKADAQTEQRHTNTRLRLALRLLGCLAGLWVCGPWAYRVPVHQQNLHSCTAVLDHLGDVMFDGERHVHVCGGWTRRRTETSGLSGPRGC